MRDGLGVLLVAAGLVSALLARARAGDCLRRSDTPRREHSLRLLGTSAQISYSKSSAPGRNRTCCLVVRRWEISPSDYQI